MKYALSAKGSTSFRLETCFGLQPAYEDLFNDSQPHILEKGEVM